MDYNRYRRYFIILDNEDGGFNNKQGKSPKGYTKIEIKNGKGVLSHYVQNLKYFKNAEYVYRGYLIGVKEDQGVYVDNGAFLIDESGKGELTWRFDPANVDGKGNNIDSFHIIAVVAETADENLRHGEVVAPLVGFINKEKIEWKHVLANRFSRKEKTKEEKELDEQYEKKYEKIKEILKDVHKKEEEIKEIVEDKEIEPYQEEELEIEINIQVEEEKEEPPIEIKEKKIEKIEEKIVHVPEEVKPVCPEEKKVVCPEEEKPICPEEKEVSVEPEGICDQDTAYDPMKYWHYQKPYNYYNHHFKMVCDYVDNILKYYKKIEPFEKNIEGCQWWRVDYNQQTLYRTFLPFYGYITNMYGYYPHMRYMAGCPDLIYKYQHYIFGKKCDEKGEPIYYLYGIPGRYMLSEQPYEGMTGFVYWHPIEDKSPQKGDYGYWILHIDAKTGNVVMPLKPTPPPRY